MMLFASGSLVCVVFSVWLGWHAAGAVCGGGVRL
jgi:hypothetical protein